MQGIPQGQSSQNSSGGSSQKPSLSWQSPSGAAHKPPQSSGGNKTNQSSAKASEKTEEQKSSMSTYAGIFIAGLIIGGLLGSVFTGQRSASTSVSNSTSTPSGATDTAGGIDLTGSAMAGELQGLVINSGQEAGATIAISSISVTQPTWVIIYDDQGGLPGRALGAQLFFPATAGGETSGSVSLVRNSLSGHSYLAGERIDDGDNTYSPANDKLLTDANGKPLTVAFTTK